MSLTILKHSNQEKLLLSLYNIPQMDTNKNSETKAQVLKHK